MSQRAAFAFDNERKAISHAQWMSAATVVRDDVGNWWAVPLERAFVNGVARPGPWNGWEQVEVDQANPHGIPRPSRIYDWATEPNLTLVPAMVGRP